MGLMGMLRAARSACRVCFGLLLAWGLGVGAVSAQMPEALQADNPTPPAAEAATAQPPATLPAADSIETTTKSVSLEAFIDGVVAAYMAKDHIAGVTVAVVDRDHVLLQKGYGIAGLDPQRAVDPQTTLFRIGSISKTFTYVAAMQLAAAGKIELDRDANAYLPAQLAIPAEGYGPVTVENLMTHTAGFEDTALGHLFVHGPEVPALIEQLARYRPHRVRPPGLHAVYSNYSVALLGALVAQVSGEPFESYVDKHEIEPLGTQSITFREPMSVEDARAIAPARAAEFSAGFQRKDGFYAVAPFEHISNNGPAGAGSASAAGMARWMRMLLNQGSLDGATVLDAASFERMASVDFRNADAVAGIAHGFFRQRYGKHLSLEHGGATGLFFSNMVVLPDAGLGVFISTNTETGRPLSSILPRLVFEQILPDARNEGAAPVKLSAQELARYAGSYRPERRPYTTLEKFFIAIGNDIEVATGPDSSLIVSAGGSAHRHVALGDGAFRNLDDGSTIAFKPAVDGVITTLATSYGHVVSDRIGWIDSTGALVLALGLLVLLSIGVLIIAWHRRGLRQRLREGRGAATWLNLAAFTWLLWVVVAVLALAKASQGGDAILFDYPTTSIRAAVVLAYIAAVATVLALFAAWPALRARSWSFSRKLRHVVVLLIMLFMVLLLARWNVLLAPLTLG